MSKKGCTHPDIKRMDGKMNACYTREGYPDAVWYADKYEYKCMKCKKRIFLTEEEVSTR